MKQYYADKLLQATVLEEMPAFPERESSILALLKRKKPGRVLPDSVEGKDEKIPSPSPVNVNQVGLFEGDRAKPDNCVVLCFFFCINWMSFSVTVRVEQYSCYRSVRFINATYIGCNF